MDSHQEYVLCEVTQENIRFIRLWFTDVAGVLKSISIDPGELEGVFSEGTSFDGSTVEDLTRVCESGMLLKPDTSTFRLLPWRSNEDPVARMFCGVLTPDERPVPSDPRGVLERAVQRAAGAGFRVMIHPEIEFYLLCQPVTPDRMILVNQAGYFDYVARGDSNDFRRCAVRMLEDMAIPIEFSYHEGESGQNEIDLRAVDLVRAADNIMATRTLIEEVALHGELVATFMPKPFIEHPGSGMHTYLLLFGGGENAFFSLAGQYRLSTTGHQFIAGLPARTEEIAATTNQHINSYKRLWGGGEAPSYVCWGHLNRSALVRVPLYKPKEATAARIEYRAPDPGANPYPAFVVLILAGLDGTEKKMELMPEAEDNVWDLSDRERQVMGIHALPASLADAVRAMESPDLVASTLGEQVFDYVTRNKRKEWTEYRQQITRQELEQFLKAVPR